AVADFFDGEKARRFRAQLAAQARDILVDGALGDFFVGSAVPDQRTDLGARQSAAAVGEKTFEKIEFFRRQRQLFSVDESAVLDEIHAQAAGFQSRERRARRTVAAQHHFDARQKFAQAERLGDVVVGAELQSQNAVGLFFARREKYKWTGRF